MLLRWLACWLPLILVGLPATLHADSAAERAELARRLRSAQHAIVGTVIDVEPRHHRNQFGDELIVSRVSVQVGEVLAGAAPGVVSVDVEGGTLAGVTLAVSDMPAVKRGDRAVFMLDGTPGSEYRLSDRGRSVLMLEETDTLRGSSLRLADVRQLVDEVRQ